MNANELPLQQLFTKLREAGLPLGIDEYQLLLRSFQGGFGIADKAALKRLCQTLWVKSAEEKAVLEYHFEQFIGSDDIVPTPETNSNIIVPTPEINSNIIVPTPETNSNIVVPTPETNSNIVVPTPETNSNIVVSTPEINSNIVVYISNKLPKKVLQDHNIYDIGPYLIIGGVGVAMGIMYLQDQQVILLTPNEILTLLTQTITPSQTTTTPSQTTTTPSQTTTTPSQTTQTQITKEKSGEPQPSLMFLSFLLTFVALGVVYVLFRWFSKLKTKPITNLPVSVPTSKFKQTREDDVQVVKSLLQDTSEHEKIPHSKFIQSREFFPITQRQMKQIWRYLRRPVREGKPTELDVEATINQIGQQGLLLDIVLVPPRVNRAELILLIDQDGSMVPFHTLSRRLAETALRGGRLGTTGIYYFHNCPIKYLYQDPYHQQGELANDIFTYRCSEWTVVLIFSDAGAARGVYNEERYELTKKFLTQLRQRVRHIAWLNPMPRKRWLGTTASEIARLVSMFEVSQPGLQDAISVLRGRPTNFEGRRK